VRIIHGSSAPWVAPVLTDNELRPRNGGAGGNGGNGGAGGVRGTGGWGVIRVPVVYGNTTYQSGHGGGGGLGGAGGSGGGGGRGGNCYGIYAYQFTVVNNVVTSSITPAVTLNGVTTYSFGTPGVGGIGGLRGGSTSSRAATGNAGATVNFDPPTP
jgi:hypothetical protein